MEKHFLKRKEHRKKYLLLHIWKPPGVCGMIGVGCELSWDVRKGMGKVGALVLLLVYGFPVLLRYKNKDQPFLWAPASAGRGLRDTCSHEEENICPVTMSNSFPFLFPIWHSACISPSQGYLFGFSCLRGRLGDKISRVLLLPLPEYSCDLG